ncbi:MAG: hypothetical protein V4490_05070, partial [Pseudomonadota bacterium]
MQKIQAIVCELLNVKLSKLNPDLLDELFGTVRVQNPGEEHSRSGPYVFSCLVSKWVKGEDGLRSENNEEFSILVKNAIKYLVSLGVKSFSEPEGLSNSKIYSYGDTEQIALYHSFAQLGVFANYSAEENKKFHNDLVNLMTTLIYVKKHRGILDLHLKLKESTEAGSDSIRAILLEVEQAYERRFHFPLLPEIKVDPKEKLLDLERELNETLSANKPGVDIDVGGELYRYVPLEKFNALCKLIKHVNSDTEDDQGVLTILEERLTDSIDYGTRIEKLLYIFNSIRNDVTPAMDITLANLFERFGEKISAYKKLTVKEFYDKIRENLKERADAKAAGRPFIQKEAATGRALPAVPVIPPQPRLPVIKPIPQPLPMQPVVPVAPVPPLPSSIGPSGRVEPSEPAKPVLPTAIDEPAV